MWVGITFASTILLNFRATFESSLAMHSECGGPSVFWNKINAEMSSLFYLFGCSLVFNRTETLVQEMAS